MEDRRRPGERAGLDRAAVVAAARDLMSEHGVEAVSMRRVAERLGVRPNALYSHVRDKAELLRACLDDALGEVRVPAEDSGGSWRTAVVQILQGTRLVLLGQPPLVAVALSGGSDGPHAQRLGQALLALLDRADLPADTASEALRVLLVHTIGVSGFDLHEHRRSRSEQDERFRRSVEWLLAGITSAGTATSGASRDLAL